MKTISLSGFMGCGKTSAGKELARLLGREFIDLDTYIEQHTGKSIPEIFSGAGEAGFRQIEKECLAEILSHGCSRDNGLVLALGGGTLVSPENAALIHDMTICIYLRATADTLTCNLIHDYSGRPMLAGAIEAANLDTAGNGEYKESPALREALRKRIETLLSARLHIYEATAHLTVDIDGLGPVQAAGKILQCLYCC